MAFAVLISAAAVSCSNPADELREKLEKATASGTVYFGHQDDLMYGHSWNANDDGDHSFTRSDVYSSCGAYPYVLGLDLGGLELGDEKNLDGNIFSMMREAAVIQDERGGIVTLSWHLHNPLTGGDAWDNSSDKAVASILPGGERHEMFLGWLDRVCDFIISCKDASGKQIPFIFRPWHEHNGGWFWWGFKTCTPEEYNALWKMTYNYLVKEKGIDWMLWAISPGAGAGGDNFDSWMSRYPGDEYVDILGTDCYEHSTGDLEKDHEIFIKTMKRALGNLSVMAEKRGKILAVTEAGFESIPEPEWWTEVLGKAIEGFPISYVLCWRNANGLPGPHHYYAPWPGQCSEDNFKKFTENGKILVLKP